MKIRKISIQNFRGIKKLDWILPDKNILCLIGKGDSAKSTLLDAIRCTFSPQWNLPFSDSDFYLCRVDETICIEILIGDLPSEFCSEQKYGAHLRGWKKNSRKVSDEPEEGDEEVLCVRLTVEKDLEPKWKIITDRNPEGVDFKSTDREKVNVSYIGSFSERQLTWAPGTALARITEGESLRASLADATRAAKNSLDAERKSVLKGFDGAASKAEAMAKTLGIPVSSSYKAHLDIGSISIKAGVLALHDGDVPLRQLGLGSRSMLLCGIQTESLNDQHITLFDELEIGLEPHRIARLVKHIKGDATGQYFLTTHSPTVLRELSDDHLHIVHKLSNVVEIVAASSETLKGMNIQGQLRKSSDAFLSLKVVVCEGATEVGFLRGIDNFLIGASKPSMSYLGVALVDARGASNIKGLANGFKALRYDVCVVADGDAPKNFSPQDEVDLKNNSIGIVVWGDKLCIEQRAMLDLPWASVVASVALAKKLDCPVRDNVSAKYSGKLDLDIEKWVDSLELRKAIGNAAKDSSWFKCISKAQEWCEIVEPAFRDKTFKESSFCTSLRAFRTWISNE